MGNYENNYPNWYKIFAFSELKKTYKLYLKENNGDSSQFVYDLNVINDIYELLKQIKNIENPNVINEIANTNAFPCLYAYFTQKNNSKNTNDRENYERNSLINLNTALKEFSKCPNVAFNNFKLDLSSYLAHGYLWEYNQIRFPENLKINTITIKGIKSLNMYNAIICPKNSTIITEDFMPKPKRIRLKKSNKLQ